MTCIGIISDTHGLLRPEVLLALSGVDHILHAGDVGDPSILDALRMIAPTTAIRGNIDVHGACSQLSATEAVELTGHIFYLVHSIHDLDLIPKVAGIAAVISGHSHQALIERRDQVLYLNPGSCGPRRFNLPVTLMILTIDKGELCPELVDLGNI